MALTRQLIFGLSPDVQKVYGLPDRHRGETLTFSTYVADGNSLQKSFTCAYVPSAKSGDSTPFQESLWLGTKGVGRTVQAMAKGQTKDDSTAIAAEAITNRLDPTIISSKTTTPKHFARVEFPGVNPLNTANNITIETAINARDPLINPVSWTSVVHSGSTNKATIKNGLGDWLHLRFSDSTAQSDVCILDALKIYYYDLAEEEGEVED